MLLLLAELSSVLFEQKQHFSSLGFCKQISSHKIIATDSREQKLAIVGTLHHLSDHQPGTMTITEAEGQAFAANFKSAFEGGFASNNHEETMKGMFADKVYLSSSDGTEVRISLVCLKSYLTLTEHYYAISNYYRENSVMMV